MKPTVPKEVTELERLRAAWRRGGLARSARKARTARQNGKRGGRPRKVAA
jgi:hypothetical protein